MRSAVGNKERWKGRRAPTQDPSNNHMISRTDCAQLHHHQHVCAAPLQRTQRRDLPPPIPAPCARTRILDTPQARAHSHTLFAAGFTALFYLFFQSAAGIYTFDATFATAASQTVWYVFSCMVRHATLSPVTNVFNRDIFATAFALTLAWWCGSAWQLV